MGGKVYRVLIRNFNPGFVRKTPKKADLIDHSLEFWLYNFKVKKSKTFVLQNL